MGTTDSDSNVAATAPLAAFDAEQETVVRNATAEDEALAYSSLAGAEVVWDALKRHTRASR